MIYDELIEELALTLLTKARYEGCISVIDGFSQCEEDKTRIEYLRDGTELPVSSHTASAVRKIYTQWRSAKKWVIG